MAQDTEQATDKTKLHVQTDDDEITTADDDIEEIFIPQKKTLGEHVTKIMENFASNRMGQMIIGGCDRMLKILEDTAKWSLPQANNDTQLVRPLPWIFFLSLIVWLRALRIWLSIGGYLVGYKWVTPHSMVYYIQTKRRNLRAIRVQGLKTIRNREMETIVMYSSNKNITFMGKLRELLRCAICKTEQHHNLSARRLFVEADKAQCSKDALVHSTKHQRDNDGVNLNLTVIEMLNKYAAEDSDSDSDYIPKEDDDIDTSITSNSSSSNISSEEETVKKNSEKPPAETTKEPEKSTSETNLANRSIVEVKENGGAKHRVFPKPLVEIKNEPLSDEDSVNEQACAPIESVNENGSGESEQTNESEMPALSSEIELAATEATTETGQQKTMTPTETTATPALQNLLAVLQLEDNKQKSTPGHESAASLKPSIITAATTVPLSSSTSSTPPNTIVEEKCYKTVTTQTSIELDWSITIKTEITHTKSYPKLEKLNCSIQLTPASSTEDIFYSPTGSAQDFHSVFRPAPLVKDSTGEDLFHS